jgi:hypothetical protein
MCVYVYMPRIHTNGTSANLTFENVRKSIEAESG